MFEDLLPFAYALAIGLLIGAERERSHPVSRRLAGWSLGTIVAIAVSATVLVAARAQPGAEPTASRRLSGRAIAALRWQRPPRHALSAV